jgi:DNA-binding transcriptional LysR family regulator
MYWDDLKIVIAIARQGTLSGAARALGVNHTTISRRLAEVERGLGRPLFDRDHSGYSLTPMGSAVLAQARVMDDAALAIEKLGDAGSELSGMVRLTTARALANGYLSARLAGLLKRYPDLEISLVAEARILSLAQREADIAIRLGRPEDTELVGSHVADIAYSFYAAPEIRRAVEAGETLRLIGFDKDNPASEGAWLAQNFPDATFPFRSNNQMSQLASARSGAGVALLPRYLAVNSGLEGLNLGAVPPLREVWLMTRRDLTKVPRFRLVIDYLTDLFRSDRHVFVGAAAADEGPSARSL